ncbi:MAG TPA: hypothetical protein VHE55_08655 [Fimbriimonadaceae bacterium]|nr:hypothetical protein [Fimbriimonadaceae bacterium]
MRLVLAAFLVLSAAQIPTGSYGLTELCDKLRAATGVAYTVDGDLSDFPVFVSTKTGDPERVKQLVADAFRARWVKDGERYRLTLDKIDPEADYPEFERLFKAATKGRKLDGAMNIHDVYRLAPGEMIRFGNPSGQFFRPFPKDFAKTLAEQGPWYVAIRRMGRGIFECRLYLPGVNTGAFSAEGDLQFAGLPADVETALKGDLGKKALTPAEQQDIQKMAAGPAAMGIDWNHIDKRDPIATIADHVLPKLAAAITPDMAIALPDVSLFVLGMSGQGGNSVRAILEPFMRVVRLTMADGAVIGELPLYERTPNTSSQVKRSVLAKFIGEKSVEGVANAQAISDYVNNQRFCASNTWTDAMMLVMAGIVVDDAYIGDYPYNARLYTHLDRSDWNLIRSGQPFLVSQLSLEARRQLYDVLLQARSRLEVEKSDPAVWSTLDAGSLSVTAELSHEDVLIGWTNFAAEIGSVRQMGTDHDLRIRALNHEPLYEPAKRQTLKLTILCEPDKQSVETGFTEVIPDPKVKPCTWDKLPEALAKEFKAAMEEARKNQNQGEGPPPPRRQAQ